MDLKNAVNLDGADYALTNEYAYNCVKSTSNTNCVYQDRGASLDNRIMYNTNTTTLVGQGSKLYSAQTDGRTKRYLVWAIFRMEATGKQFLFTNTHLDPYSSATRQAQWDESIRLINDLKGALPVVAVGDYNTSKFTDYAATYLPRMKQNGYGDVLNQAYAQPYVKSPRTESVAHAWISSFNNYRRDVRPYAYEDARGKTGNGIDWIFASNTVRVKQWAVVVNVDPTTLAITGIIPSDHAMVRATLTLP